MIIRIAITQAAYDAVVASLPPGGVKLLAGAAYANGNFYIHVDAKTVDRLTALRH